MQMPCECPAVTENALIPANRNKKGLTPNRRKSLCCKVRETGLEPAPPLQGLGPQPSASANSAIPADALLYASLGEIGWPSRSGAADGCQRVSRLTIKMV